LDDHERRQLLAALMRERYGPYVIHDPDEEAYTPSTRPDTNLDTYAAELLDWRAA
jgi:hypothetical protein